MSGDIEATIAECSICLNGVSVVVLSKRALKDLSVYCTFYFFFLFLVKLFMLPGLIALVNNLVIFNMLHDTTVIKHVYARK